MKKKLLVLELGGLLSKLYCDQGARKGRWAQVEERRHWALGEQAQGGGARHSAGLTRARLGEAGHAGARGSREHGAGVRGALGRAAAGAQGSGARTAAGAWACGVRTEQAWVRLCTPGCAQLGQVRCFVHSDSVFNPV